MYAAFPRSEYVMNHLTSRSPSRRPRCDTCQAVPPPGGAGEISHVHRSALPTCRALRPRGRRPAVPRSGNGRYCLLGLLTHRPSQQTSFRGSITSAFRLTTRRLPVYAWLMSSPPWAQDSVRGGVGSPCLGGSRRLWIGASWRTETRRLSRRHGIFRGSNGDY